MLLFWGWLMVVMLGSCCLALLYCEVVSEREHKEIVHKYKKLIELYEAEIEELETLIDK